MRIDFNFSPPWFFMPRWFELCTHSLASFTPSTKRENAAISWNPLAFSLKVPENAAIHVLRVV